MAPLEWTKDQKARSLCYEYMDSPPRCPLMPSPVFNYSLFVFYPPKRDKPLKGTPTGRLIESRGYPRGSDKPADGQNK